jgi:hypothetical protein
MGLPKLFSREVFIRLEGGEIFATTVKYGCFYSKTKELKVYWEASAILQESASPSPTYLVPPPTMPHKKQGECGSAECNYPSRSNNCGSSEV